MKVKIRCPRRGCVKRTYADVKVGDTIECSYCRQPFTVTEFAEHLDEGAPLGYKDREGVPLAVATADVWAWKNANWPGWSLSEIEQLNKKLSAERALADDLYDMWRRSMNPALRDEPQVVALDARYREARR